MLRGGWRPSPSASWRFARGARPRSYRKSLALRAPLAARFVKSHCGGHARIERVDGAAHRETCRSGARAAHGFLETLALGTNHEEDGPGEVDMGDGARQRRDPTENGVFDGSGRSAKRGR